jgi:hypothetical protein
MISFIKKNTAFWLITGIFSAISVIIPVTIFEYYYSESLSTYDLQTILGVAAFAYGYMHIFISFAYYSNSKKHTQI